jgi:DNA-binding XRE family transcriptional regulator
MWAMPFHPSPEVHALLGRARSLLQLSQSEMGDRFGSSRRTVSRWESGGATPGNAQIHDIVRAVHPRDAKLAAALAAETGTTLEAMGLVRPPPPPPAPGPPSPPPRPFPPIPLVVDSMVLAAMEAFDPSSPDVRRMLRAACARARAMGLTIEEIDDALASQNAPNAGPKPSQGQTRPPARRPPRAPVTVATRA